MKGSQAKGGTTGERMEGCKRRRELLTGGGMFPKRLRRCDECKSGRKLCCKTLKNENF